MPGQRAVPQDCAKALPNVKEPFKCCSVRKRIGGFGYNCKTESDCKEKEGVSFDQGNGFKCSAENNVPTCICFGDGCNGKAWPDTSFQCYVGDAESGKSLEKCVGSDFCQINKNGDRVSYECGGSRLEAVMKKAKGQSRSGCLKTGKYLCMDTELSGADDGEYCYCSGSGCNDAWPTAKSWDYQSCADIKELKKLSSKIENEGGTDGAAAAATPTTVAVAAGGLLLLLHNFLLFHPNLPN